MTGRMKESMLTPMLPFDFSELEAPEPERKKPKINRKRSGIRKNPRYDVRDGILVEYRGSRRNLVIPGNLGITGIGNGVFQGRENLKSVNIPIGVTAIGGSAFFNCYNLESINIPDGITIIEDSTFSFCQSLKSITIPASITRIGDDAFGLCIDLEIIRISDGVTHIENNAFSCCFNLNSIVISASVTIIGNAVFSCCYKLTGIEVDQDNPCFVSIDGVLFDKYTNRLVAYPAGKSGSSYTIPGSVTIIEDGAFSYCGGLNFVRIPGGVTRIGKRAFIGCENLIGIEVDRENPRFVSIGGVLFDKIEGRIMAYPAGKEDSEYIIPSGITIIEESLFLFCHNLKTVIIPDSIISIGGSAFYGCDNLETITIPSGVAIVGRKAFSGCKNLKTVYLSRRTKIGKDAFEHTPAKLFYID